jgi:hypothetical protein
VDFQSFEYILHLLFRKNNGILPPEIDANFQFDLAQALCVVEMKNPN